jgi:exonuclease III
MEGRGTAIITKEAYRMSNIRRIPNGRGISGRINGITIINLYAPAGTERNRERETFYNNDISSLLHDYNEHTILTGDLNCVLQSIDCTGQPSMSRVLVHFVMGLNLQDAWQQRQGAEVYTHYTPMVRLV